MSRRLYKTERNKMVFGVCAGLSEEFGIEISLLRVIWSIVCVAYGIGLIVYLLCAAIFPTE